MYSVLSGLIIAGAGAVGLWYAVPHNGQVRAFAKKPFIDSLVPIAIVSALAIGVALIVAGLV
jgi:hypothetical protein